MRTRPILLRTPTLAELIAAVSLSDFVLSPDGAVVHIAAALRIPQVALFGRTSEGQWAPVNEKSVLLKGSRADRIPVDEVVSAAVSVVSQWERGRGHETPRGGARGDPAPAGPGGRDAGEG
jgi:ADP-heptose:LPS heptosyltransferase